MSNRNLIALFALSVACCALPPAAAAAAPPSLDRGSGDLGVVSGGSTTAGYRNAAAVAVAPDRRILVAAAGDGITAVARYLPGGALDPSFGDGGVSQLFSVAPPNGSSIEAVGGVRQMVVDREGRAILLLRRTTLLRLNADGSVDEAWSDAATESLSGGDFVTLASLTDGRLLVAGREIVRLRADGSRDPSFGQQGSFDLRSDPRGARVATRRIAVSPGGILVAGSWGPRPALVRLSPDGAVDRSFGSSGRVVLPRSLRGQATALTAMGNGASLLSCDCGRVDRRGSLLPVFRFGPAGRLDRRFSATSLTHRVGRHLRPHLALAAGRRVVLVGGSTGSTIRLFRRGRGPVVVSGPGVPRDRLMGVVAARQGKKLLVAWTPRHKIGAAEVRLARFTVR